MFKITAVTATRNRANWLPRCLESVANQPYPCKEHIVIDGASTDGTVALLEEAASRFPHLRWISEPDGGLSEAFNKGLRLATGDALGVIGDDDYYAPNVFGLVAAAFEQYPEAGLVSGGCAFVRDDGTVAFTQQARFSSRTELIRCWRHWGQSVTLPAPSTFIRKTAIDVVGGFDERDRYAMDYRHWIKLTERFPVHTLNALLASFRCDTGTISFSHQRRQWDETLAISKEYWGPLGSRGYWEHLVSYLRWYQWHRVKNRVRRMTGRPLEQPG